MGPSSWKFILCTAVYCRIMLRASVGWLCAAGERRAPVTLTFPTMRHRRCCSAHLTRTSRSSTCVGRLGQRSSTLEYTLAHLAHYSTPVCTRRGTRELVPSTDMCALCLVLLGDAPVVSILLPDEECTRSVFLTRCGTSAWVPMVHAHSRTCCDKPGAAPPSSVSA